MAFHILFRGFDNQFIESVVLNKFKHICVKYRARDEIVTHLRNDSPFFLSFPFLGVVAHSLSMCLRLNLTRKLNLYLDIHLNKDDIFLLCRF